TFFTDSDVYTGFTVAVAQGVEPSLSWQLGTAAAASNPGDVYINVVGANEIALTSKSASGTLFCIAENEAAGGGQHLGKNVAPATYAARSEERRVGKEGAGRRRKDHHKKRGGPERAADSGSSLAVSWSSR